MHDVEPAAQQFSPVPPSTEIISVGDTRFALHAVRAVCDLTRTRRRDLIIAEHRYRKSQGFGSTAVSGNIDDAIVWRKLL